MDTIENTTADEHDFMGVSRTNDEGKKPKLTSKIPSTLQYTSSDVDVHPKASADAAMVDAQKTPPRPNTKRPLDAATSSALAHTHSKHKKDATMDTTSSHSPALLPPSIQPRGAAASPAQTYTENNWVFNNIECFERSLAQGAVV
jgi:hypothetical protein